MGLPIKLPKGIVRKAGKILLKLRARSPEVCVVGGIVLGGAALVMTGVNTWKGKEELTEDVKSIKEAKVVKAEETEDEAAARKKELWNRRLIFVKDVGKRYWLPVTLGLSSAGLVWGGRTILRKELSAMTALAATLSDRYKKLYERVKQEYGDEKAQELAYGTKLADVIDGDTGKIEQQYLIDKKRVISPYAVFFDQGEFDEETGEWIWRNYEWHADKFSNIVKIRNVQNYWNDILRAHGWVLWSDVAKDLGLKPDPAWNRVGWVNDEDGTKHIELGVLDGPFQLEVNKRFMDEHDKLNVALIDPNVDGCIDFVFDDIEKYDKRCGRRAKHSIRDKKGRILDFRKPEDDSEEETCLIRGVEI